MNDLTITHRYLGWKVAEYALGGRILELLPKDEPACPFDRKQYRKTRRVALQHLARQNLCDKGLLPTKKIKLRNRFAV
jgi:hypothetical protein